MIEIKPPQPDRQEFKRMAQGRSHQLCQKIGGSKPILTPANPSIFLKYHHTHGTSPHIDLRQRGYPL